MVTRGRWFIDVCRKYTSLLRLHLSGITADEELNGNSCRRLGRRGELEQMRERCFHSANPADTYGRQASATARRPKKPTRCRPEPLWRRVRHESLWQGEAAFLEQMIETCEHYTSRKNLVKHLAMFEAGRRRKRALNRTGNQQRWKLRPTSVSVQNTMCSSERRLLGIRKRA